MSSLCYVLSRDQLDDIEMRPVNDAAELPEVLHGTFRQFWPDIGAHLPLLPLLTCRDGIAQLAKDSDRWSGRTSTSHQVGLAT
jgi:hypothetical protein